MKIEKQIWWPWFVVLSAGLFFFYEFIQMNLLNGISDAVIADLHLSSTEFGWLSSTYFLSTVLFLFVAGMLLDRFSPRRIILTSLVICITGIVLFARAQCIETAMIARFLSGIGSAFCFLSVIRLASRWFPPQKMALVTGCIVTMAMTGALVAQTPLTLLLEHVTWRWALLVDAGFGWFIFLLISLFVQDFPLNSTEISEQEWRQLHQLGYLRSMRLAFCRGQNWLAGGYTSLMNLIVILLGGTWGKLYLLHTHKVQALQASYITSLMFIGAIIGGPVAGWLSDHWQRRCRPMQIGAIVCLILVGILMTASLSTGELLVLFFLLGIATSTQVIGYPFVAENSPRLITAMSVSVVSLSTQLGLFLAEPLFGYLMDLHHDFRWAMTLFPISFVLAIVIAGRLRETYCRLEQNAPAVPAEAGTASRF